MRWHRHRPFYHDQLFVETSGEEVNSGFDLSSLSFHDNIPGAQCPEIGLSVRVSDRKQGHMNQPKVHSRASKGQRSAGLDITHASAPNLSTLQHLPRRSVDANACRGLHE